MTTTEQLRARQTELLDELDGLTRRASIGHDGVWENERRRVVHLELSTILSGGEPAPDDDAQQPAEGGEDPPPQD